MSETLAQALQELQGSALSSVEFVQDYLQLRFDGPCLTAYTHPVITHEHKVFLWNDPGYPEILRKLITHVLVTAKVLDKQQISLIFDNEILVTISLRDQDYRGPEALQYVSDPSHWWVV